ncbi:cupin domain-containing protein [Lysinibacillus sp. BW-2-10]|uniref:cupin domain-containing protein n=1 Tax=Lysinibacillus sp. BW-2-10 TaxID=2590030 RepID=UPI00117DB377|nr:cupin domain-containing protein [Lysinibacillus sp. BW-2-10]TSI10069.1 cupin domain-containing protein [Lysinibacillus sp. BW-2-10]
MEILSTPYVLKEKAKQVGKIFGQENFDVLNIQLKTGEQVPTHHADCDVLIIVKSGVVTFTVEEETVDLTSEQVLYIKPFEKHGLVAKEDVDLIVMKIK